MKDKRKKSLGFTLLELIIVVTIIALLAAATFVAVDPAQRIGDANNAQRWSDVTAVLNAVLTYVVDNNGTYPSAIPSASTSVIGTGADDGACLNGTDTCTATSVSSGVTTCTNLATDLVGTYLATIPQDPLITTPTASYTDYYIYRSAGGRITVGACETYNSETIQVSR